MASHTADPGHTVLQGGPSSGRKQKALAPPWPSAANTKLQRELENLETCTEGHFHSYLRLCQHGAVHLAWRLTPGCLHNRVLWKGFGWSVAGRAHPPFILSEVATLASCPVCHPRRLLETCSPASWFCCGSATDRTGALVASIIYKRVRHQVWKEREVGGGRRRTAKPKEGSPLFSPQEAQPLSGILFS